MKHIVTAILMLTLGAAGLYAQEIPVKVTLSGTAAASTVNLQTGTGTSEYRLAGNGTLGPFTLRVVSAGAASPQPSSTCSGLYIPTLAGRAVLRLQDGSLLRLDLADGSDCISLTGQGALCIRTFQVLGGTGRFADASGGTVTLNMTVIPVVPNKFNFFAVTAGMTGAISGMADDSSQNPQQ